MPAILIVIVTIAVLWPVCTCEFTGFDDEETVAHNSTLNPPTFESVKVWWSEPYMDLYVPVTYMTWGAVASIAGVTPEPGTGISLNPYLFHTANLLLHLFSALVVFQILALVLARCAAPRKRSEGLKPVADPEAQTRRGLRTTYWAACAGAILFAIHPVQVEPVAWVSGLKDLQYGLLSLLALWLYLISVMPGEPAIRGAGATPLSASFPHRVPYLTATVCLALAMLSKPTAMVVPLLAATLDLLIVGRPIRKVAASVAPWMLLAVPCAICAKWAQPAMQAGVAPPILFRPLVAADALSFYLLKLVWPAHLAVDYGRIPNVVIHSRWIYFSWLLPGAAIAILWFMRKNRALLAGAALFFIPLIPLLGLIRFDFQTYSTVADHYLYLPMAGVAMIVAAALARLTNPRWTILCALIFGTLAARSWFTTWNWRDSTTLFEHALEINPRSALALNSLSVIYQRAGETDKAIAYARQAVALGPTQATPWLALGVALTKEGKLAEAGAAYRQAVLLEPQSVPALNNLSANLAAQGQIDAAIPLARQALELEPDSPDAHLNLGTMLFHQRDLAGAEREFRRVVELAPGNPAAHNSLAAALAAAGQREQAIEQYRAALQIDPNSAQARRGLMRLGVGNGDHVP